MSETHTDAERAQRLRRAEEDSAYDPDTSPEEAGREGPETPEEIAAEASPDRADGEVAEVAAQAGETERDEPQGAESSGGVSAQDAAVAEAVTAPVEPSGSDAVEPPEARAGVVPDEE
ncbi:MAG: hypothetical protein ACRDJ5_02110, partial [Actinomycetota bacterium]